ncbi:3-deoxy-7-phosphoheptulonate synthase [Lentilactobacillus buchneri]|uniref:DAHP synthetase I/KDSA domain-containing protein n=1 Tax=Lentilactobacillus buchneri DSM 20057 TaxID=1423728 RepID=A0A4R5NRE0_LENBU|nr:3-deoxy-7-phosphoheptulonate synthase [Lentilactobacillus buchneri]WCJ50874.1 3-deoxy-7-phosphoheptulonate synthase [Lentilactobacillus sp. Egmn17]AEB74582.1 phospho-2-dehydro-3-deoxyheptonate aldolase [Lentilactobacillus buchneri NRRL B-30929]MCT2881991.1 3-deoxy-7-phosphoheptulonate synthase [Lentilactobacillus buchneri]MCT3251880.1 3-deoxy-7-phosphoheptulonate synthase [Lentilactobacillus buchneri]MCT3546468.1 3-deoxy-7-phosphoheptulonate synthase [Lentilactobacillus buchneri]
MIIVLKNGHEDIIDEIKSRFTETNEVFVHNNRVAIQGVSEDGLNAEEKNAIDLIIDNVPAAVQGSRLFHPEDTVVVTPHSQIGGDNFTMMAGPCSVESAEHVMKMAKVAKSGGATILRGGAFKPRTSPYSFQGLGEDGLKFLRAAADAYDMDVLTEVMDQDHVAMVEQYTDIFQIGARNMQNFSLLKAVGKTQTPVMLKRGMSATIDDILNAAEYIAAGGNHNIIITERGIRTFDNKYTRNTLDVGAVPVLQKLTHYPVIVDPSHAAGHTEFVTPEALAGVAVGASGLVVEIHDDPAHAFSDGAQALKPDEYRAMAQQAFAIRKVITTPVEEKSEVKL